MEIIYKDVPIPPDNFPVLGSQIPVRSLIEHTVKNPADHIAIYELNHKDLSPLIDCRGVMRVKVKAREGGITTALCQGCGKREFVDVEELALRPYLEKVHQNLT